MRIGRKRGPGRWSHVPQLAVLTLVSLAVSSPLWPQASAIVNADLYRAYDWLEAAKHANFTRDGLLGHGGFALWNPFLEGGLPSYAHPSDGSFSLSFLTILLLGEAIGMKVNVVLLLMAAALGSYGLAREWLRLDTQPALVVGLLTAVCGWIPGGVAVGFYESCFLALVPGFLYFVLRAAREPSPSRAILWIALSGAFLLVGGIQMQLCLAFAVLQMVLWAGLGAREAVRSLVAALTFCAGLGAVKFLPMLEFVHSRGGRTVHYDDPAPWWSLLVRPTWGLFSMVPERTEYSAAGIPLSVEYDHAGMAMIAGVLAIVAFSRCSKKAFPLAALLVATAAMGWEAGGGFNVSLLSLVHWLPGFSAIRESYRYVSFFLALWLCLSAGLGFAWLQGWSQDRGGFLARPGMLLGLFVLLLIPQAYASASLYGSIFSEESFERLEEPTSFIDIAGNSVKSPDESLSSFHSVLLPDPPSPGRRDYDLAPYLAARSNVGALYIAEDLPPAAGLAARPLYTWSADDQAILNPRWLGEAWIDEGEGKAGFLRLGANRLQVDVHTRGPATLLINQNYYRGWRVDEPAEVRAQDGLIAVRLPAAHSGPVELRFQSLSLRLGAAVSLFFLLGVFVIWRLKVGLSTSSTPEQYAESEGSSHGGAEL